MDIDGLDTRMLTGAGSDGRETVVETDMAALEDAGAGGGTDKAQTINSEKVYPHLLPTDSSLFDDD
jgi:hypothetical protein